MDTSDRIKTPYMLGEYGSDRLWQGNCQATTVSVFSRLSPG